MTTLKKTGLTLGLFPLILGGVSHQNLASAVSDKAIEIHDKTKELVNLTAEYYTKEKEYFQDSSKIYDFIGKLNEKQLNVFKNSFGDCGFPQFVNNGSEISLSISIKSINLLVAAVESGDLEFVKLIVENFDIPDINQTDDCGHGSPLWCAVCLANEKDIDNQTAKDIVDYLLSIGANPYENSGKSYIPDLFKNISSSSPRMIFKEVFEKHGYYNIINDKTPSQAD